jgi:hypothetical protein
MCGAASPERLAELSSTTGAQAKDAEQFTVWRMSLYGAVMADEDNTPAQIGYVLTAPKAMAAANEFIRLLERVHEPKAA